MTAPKPSRLHLPAEVYEAISRAACTADKRGARGRAAYDVLNQTLKRAPSAKEKAYFRMCLYNFSFERKTH